MRNGRLPDWDKAPFVATTVHQLTFLEYCHFHPATTSLHEMQEEGSKTLNDSCLDFAAYAPAVNGIRLPLLCKIGRWESTQGECSTPTILPLLTQPCKRVS